MENGRSFGRRDFFVLVFLLAAGFLGLALLLRPAGGGAYAAVHFNGELVLVVSLDSGESGKRFALADGLPRVVFGLDGGAFYFAESNCPDLLCVKAGPLSHPGAFAACLPNDVFFVIHEADHALRAAAFAGYFDTIALVQLYAPSREAFEFFSGALHGELRRLDRLFDIHAEAVTEGPWANIAGINAMAGIAPVAASGALFGLVEDGLRAYDESGGALDIAMGPALALWRDFISGNSDAPPAMRGLEEARRLSGMRDVELDRDAGTVFLRREGASLDAGALAKGAALCILRDLAMEMGVSSGIISIGGDIVLLGSPPDGRAAWTVGIDDPFGDGLFGSVEVAAGSIAASGNYRRAASHEGRRYHHIIDPATLMPAARFASVTVIHDCPRTAEMLSTAAFILPLEAGRALVERHGAMALWLFEDGSHASAGGFALQRAAG